MSFMLLYDITKCNSSVSIYVIILFLNSIELFKCLCSETNQDGSTGHLNNYDIVLGQPRGLSLLYSAVPAYKLLLIEVNLWL